MKKTITLLSLAFLVPLAMIAQQQSITKSYSGVKSIRMTTAAGDCQFVKATDGKVTVNLRHTYDDKGFEPTFSQEGDRLEIREQFHGNNFNGSSSWTVTIPEGLDVRFTTGSGNIQASDMKLNLDANTGSGDLIFRKITGDLKANTGSGDFEMDDFNGELDINIGSGSARVAGVQGDVKLNCGSGNIRLLDSKAEFRANTGSGDVRGSNITLAGSSRFNSGSGDADVLLATSPKFDISVNSGSGSAQLNFNGNEIAGEITMEANKRGGRIEAPFEFDHTEEFSNGGNSVMVRKTVIKGSATPRIHVGTGSGDAVIKK